jgi:hypothetical protein
MATEPMMGEPLNLTIQESDMVHLKPEDPGFVMVDGFSLVSRASIEINPNCPAHIANAIAFAMERGWIQPRASLRREEYMLDRMRYTG